MPKEIPVTEPHKPIAFARSNFSVNTCVIIDIATGFNIEPPIPCNMRNAINCPGVCEIPHRKDAKPKQAKPN